MDPNQMRELNQKACRQLKPSIDQTYPKGRFVAIHGGEVIADATTFEELDGILDARGFGPDEVLVLQAGVHYPEFVYILFQGAGS